MDRRRVKHPLSDAALPEVDGSGNADEVRTGFSTTERFVQPVETWLRTVAG